jgi:hypothetical protein
MLRRSLLCPASGGLEINWVGTVRVRIGRNELELFTGRLSVKSHFFPPTAGSWVWEPGR